MVIPVFANLIAGEVKNVMVMDLGSIDPYFIPC
jgi:hypothetical protein